MKPSLATKLTQLAARLSELDGLLAAPEVTHDLDRYRALSREYAEIAPVVALHRDWQQAERDLASALERLADAEMKTLADDEAKAAKATMERLEEGVQRVLLPGDADDERNGLREVRAG